MCGFQVIAHGYILCAKINDGQDPDNPPFGLENTQSKAVYIIPMLHHLAYFCFSLVFIKKLILKGISDLLRHGTIL
jgi:hypothetical protein